MTLAMMRLEVVRDAGTVDPSVEPELYGGDKRL